MRRCIIILCLLIAASFGYTPALACCPLAQAAASQTIAEAPCPMHAKMTAAAPSSEDPGDKNAATDHGKAEHGKSVAKHGCGCIAHSVSADGAQLTLGRDFSAATQPRAVADVFISFAPEQTTPPPKHA
jgi:hypothetical protein